MLKQFFPILGRRVHDTVPLTYLDSAATSHAPLPVIEAISNYYLNHRSNVHRGIHQLSEESTQVWEDSRQVVERFLGAGAGELIITRNATEALNGVAYGWGWHQVEAGDVIISTVMEHHANLVPWQELAKNKGAELRLLEVDEAGRLNLEPLPGWLEQLPVKLVAISHVSNTLGTINPISEVVSMVRKYGRSSTRVVVDGAQAVPHLPVDFHSLGADFYAFSGHKMLGPMGIGGLLVRRELLDTNEMRPWLFGGGMIEGVMRDRAVYHSDPAERFTAGTPDVASMVGLAAACQFLTDQVGGMAVAAAHDQKLIQLTLQVLKDFPQVTVIGPTLPRTSAVELDRSGSVAFVYEGVHAHDVAQILDSEGVAVRSGHHCTMPLHQACGWVASTRVSFQIYNDEADIETFARALKKVHTVFGV
jgi:cysteine desulfurase / selenocysteine lyase